MLISAWCQLVGTDATRVRPYNSLQMGMQDVMLKIATIQMSHKQNVAEWKTEEHVYRKAVINHGRTEN
jgi:hypothetical protein